MVLVDVKLDLPLPKRIWQYWDKPCTKLGFYRSFQVEKPVSARFYFSASGTSSIWFDQQEINLPTSNLPSWYSMKSMTLPLSAGQHEFFIIVDEDSQTMPFMLCCLDWEADGKNYRLGSDDSWFITADPSAEWIGQNGGENHARAWEHGGVWVEPWGMPCNAPDDFCRLSHGWQEITEENVTKVVQIEPGLKSAGGKLAVQVDGVIRAVPVKPYPLTPLEYDFKRPSVMWHLIRELQSLKTNNWLNMFEFRNPSVVFDVGKETFARLKVRVRSGGKAIIALASGESYTELNHYSRRISDVFVLEDGETFTTSPSGFRFIKLIVLGSSGSEVVLEPLCVQHIRYPVGKRGVFTCSDSDLNKIWDLSLETVHLCMQNEIWDGIRRDQLPWMGDLYVEALAAYIFFADNQLTRQTLATLADLGPTPARSLDRQRYPGLQAIWRTENGDINGIPSYTLWWMVGLSDYLRYTGDIEFIRELKEELIATLHHFVSHIDETDMWITKGKFNYIDWAPVPGSERQVFCHMLTCRVLGLGLELLAAVGAVEEIQNIRDVQDRIIQRARKAMNVTAGEPVASQGISHHVNAMAILSGALDAGEALSLFENSLQDDPAFMMTYWHRFDDLEAAAVVGKTTWGLNYIRKHWGKILQINGSTLWEAFDASWLAHEDPHSVAVVGDEYSAYGGYRTSLCHGWSAGAAVWLSTVILGIAPAAPGFKRIAFKPDLGDLQWAKGVIPTPMGNIEVSLAMEAGRKKALLTIPSQMEVEIDDHVDRDWSIHITTI